MERKNGDDPGVVVVKSNERALVVYHSADYDGIFSGAACWHWLRKTGFDVDLVGWDHNDAKVVIGLHHSRTFVVDLPPSCIDLEGFDWDAIGKVRAVANIPPEFGLTWIDHHASAIANKEWSVLPGVRIDGVAACRLCWNWFDAEYQSTIGNLATKEEYVSRKVPEPIVLTLVGEYDVWDKRDRRAEELQYGLTLTGPWHPESVAEEFLTGSAVHGTPGRIVEDGRVAKKWFQNVARQGCVEGGSLVHWQGIAFWCLPSVHARGSQWFPDDCVPEEAEALMAMRIKGGSASFSLYRRPGRDHPDILSVAKSFEGGGGHEGACGFTLSIERCIKEGLL